MLMHDMSKLNMYENVCKFLFNFSLSSAGICLKYRLQISRRVQHSPVRRNSFINSFLKGWGGREGGDG